MDRGSPPGGLILVRESDQLLKEPLVYKGGYAEVPNRRRLGVEFDEEACRVSQWIRKAAWI